MTNFIGVRFDRVNPLDFLVGPGPLLVSEVVLLFSLEVFVELGYPILEPR